MGGRRFAYGVAWVLIAIATISCRQPARSQLILATATSVQDSGLLEALVAAFEQDHDYRVSTLAIGTGEALELARRGETDVLLTHAPELELASIAAGFTIRRRVVMTNHFVLVGPREDPAGVRATRTASEALEAIARADAPFVSRGDDSGTHLRELALWAQAGGRPPATQYAETGQGQGPTLMVANERRAYALADQATFLAFADQLDLVSLIEPGEALINRYAVLEVNPGRFEHLNARGARAFADFLVGEPAQSLIAAHGLATLGHRLFLPAAEGSRMPTPGSG